MNRMKKVIIDTDIGTDVDDALALVYALNSKLLDIKAITTVHGDTNLRGKIAKKLCNLLKPNLDIPVLAGYEKPLKSDKLFWAGFEGNDLDLRDIKLHNKNIDEFLRDTIIKYKGIELISLAPCTNIASLFQKFPEVKSYINKIYLMNRIKNKENKLILDEMAYNTKVDPYAAEIVFNSKIPLTIITTEISKETYLTMGDFEELKSLSLNWTDIIYNNAKNWLNFSKYKIAYLYDPLTVAVAENPSIVKTKTINNIEITVGLNINFKERFLNKLTK